MRIFQRIVLCLFVLVLLLFLGVKAYDRFVLDHQAPVIQCDSEVITVSVNDPEEALLQGVTATDQRDGDLTDQVMVKSVSGLITADTAKVTYVVFDSSNNAASCSRKVQYSDYERPHFSLDTPLVYRTGSQIRLLDRLHASDVIDGDISHSLRVTAQNVYVDVPGIYSVTVQVTNSMGDTAVLPLTLVIDNDAAYQVIYLTEYIAYVEEGSAFDPKSYVEKVTPNTGGAAGAEDLEIVSNVDTSVCGSYEVSYTYHFPGSSRSYTLYQTVVVE